MTEQDERIVAWLDGELSDEELARFEAAMEADPALAAKAARWLANDDLLRAAFEAPVLQGVDDALLSRMGLAKPQRTPVAANDNPPWRRWALPAGGLIAAGLALALMLPGNLIESGAGGGEATQIAAAMETLPSRSALAMADGGKISPVLSFAASDGRFCREFTVSGGAQPGGGIACKSSSGWMVEARSRVGAQTADPGKFATAGGAGNNGLDSAYARLGASDPLSGDAERRLIAAGWKKMP